MAQLGTLAIAPAVEGISHLGGGRWVAGAGISHLGGGRWVAVEGISHLGVGRWVAGAGISQFVGFGVQGAAADISSGVEEEGYHLLTKGGELPCHYRQMLTRFSLLDGFKFRQACGQAGRQTCRIGCRQAGRQVGIVAHRLNHVCRGHGSVMST